ncbi:MAG: hypothetical protein RR946_08030, partial [Clostridia bacterium]
MGEAAPLFACGGGGVWGMDAKRKMVHMMCMMRTMRMVRMATGAAMLIDLDEGGERQLGGHHVWCPYTKVGLCVGFGSQKKVHSSIKNQKKALETLCFKGLKIAHCKT